MPHKVIKVVANRITGIVRGKLIRVTVGVLTVATAGVGLVADILGLRSSGGDSPAVVATTDVSQPRVVLEDLKPEATTTTTTMIQESRSPVGLLAELQTELSARASSGVLEVCDTEAFLLTSNELLLFKWFDEKGWVDFSDLVRPPTALLPVGLAVVDIPRDGRPDIVVVFERSGSSPQLSGVLSVPNTATGCGQGYSWSFFGQPDGSFSQLVPNLETTSDGFLSRATSITLVEFRWNKELQYFQHVGSQTIGSVIDDLLGDPEIERQFAYLYGRFSTESFTAMLQLVEPNSPAERFILFLLDGKRAGRDAGFREGTGYPVSRVGEAWRIEFVGTPTLLTNFLGSQGKIRSFSMNEVPLEQLIRYQANAPIVSRECSESGVCLSVRGVQLGNRSTYIALEVDASATVASAKLTNAWLATGSIRQRQRSSTSGLVRSPRKSIWGLTFELSELPWGSSLEVQISVNGESERVFLQIPS